MKDLDASKQESFLIDGSCVGVAVGGAMNQSRTQTGRGVARNTEVVSGAALQQSRSDRGFTQRAQQTRCLLCHSPNIRVEILPHILFGETPNKNLRKVRIIFKSRLLPYPAGGGESLTKS